MAKKVCDFCLNEGGGFFSGFEKLTDGHYMCKDCKSIIQGYKLPLKHDLFQCLVTAQSNMKEMIMDAYLETNTPDDTIAKFFPMPAILLHGGEKCVNAFPASVSVNKESIPESLAETSIVNILKDKIHNIPDCTEKDKAQIVEGMLYETDLALYFLSEHFINCHRLGYIQRNTKEKNRVIVTTPTKVFTYKVDHADMFFLRERFYNKVNAAKHNKRQHLIYMSADNKVIITPGSYDIAKSLKPGKYRVKAIKDAGLHIKNHLGKVVDIYETEDPIELHAGSTLECTGEYQLQWIADGEKK
ncbi:MAG: hypothetical protein IJ875_00695 [Solobacterium sp.]|nr:hypothetical protein [Solobacterium sp.]